jgi:hypothetical protein
VTVSKTELAFNQKTVAIKELNGNYLGTNFTGNGTLNNLVGYAMQDLPLTGTLNIAADNMNLNDWMATATDTTTSTPTAKTAEPFIVPSNIDLTIITKAQKVKYDKVDYNNINGTVVVKEETVKLQNVKTDALDGTIAFTGSYSTKTNKKEPAISMSYDVKNVNCAKSILCI